MTCMVTLPFPTCINVHGDTCHFQLVSHTQWYSPVPAKAQWCCFSHLQARRCQLVLTIIVIFKLWLISFGNIKNDISRGLKDKLGANRKKTFELKDVLGGKVREGAGSSGLSLHHSAWEPPAVLWCGGEKRDSCCSLPTECSWSQELNGVTSWTVLCKAWFSDPCRFVCLKAKFMYGHCTLRTQCFTSSPWSSYPECLHSAELDMPAACEISVGSLHLFLGSFIPKHSMPLQTLPLNLVWVLSLCKTVQTRWFLTHNTCFPCWESCTLWNRYTSRHSSDCPAGCTNSPYSLSFRPK